ncbi:MAG: T9SS type A sorting domain-containing protein [Dysgonamonadaceae bacterium]|jgi:hypothetical protein|nr:T9SS type A sorting domain-containing protein [Dysgonamonadaceae bacterium]
MENINFSKYKIMKNITIIKTGLLCLMILCKVKSFGLQAGYPPTTDLPGGGITACQLVVESTDPENINNGYSRINYSLKYTTDCNISKLQCKNTSDADWKYISPSVAGFFNYSDFIGIDDLDPFANMHFRVEREGGRDYSLMSYPICFIPLFEFPAGTDLIIEPPKCAYDSAIIKIPFEGDTNYTVTIGKKNVNVGSNANTYEANLFPDITENGTRYYRLAQFMNPDDYRLTIEYKDNGIKASPFDTVFTIPYIPPFTISAPTYLSHVDTFEIPKYNGKGDVSFYVSGSSTSSVNIYNGNTIITPVSSNLILQSNGYYSGDIVVALKAGTYKLKVRNNYCETFTNTFTLNQPEPITFDKTEQNPKCYNESGYITIKNVHGGISPYKCRIGGNEYNYYSDSITISVFSGATVTISDNYGNKTTKSFNIAPAPSPVTINTVITPPTIFNANNGKVEITANGGAPQYSYKKKSDYNYQSSSTLTGFSSGEDTVCVMDNNGCEFKFPVYIPQGKQISIISKTITAPVCYGGNDGKCVLYIGNKAGTLSVSSSLPFTISSDSIITFNNLGAGKYSCTITDTYGAYPPYSITDTFIVGSKPELKITSTVTHVSNKGAATGKITVVPSGGNPGNCDVFLYEENNNQPLQSSINSCVFENLKGAAGGGKLYKIKVIDSEGCEKINEVRILEPDSALVLAATVTHVSCRDYSDGKVEISASGGWGGYKCSEDSITWHTDSIKTFTGLSAGIYKYFVKDRNNGTASVSVTVDNPEPLSILVDSISSVRCNGATTGAIRYLVAGGTAPYSLTPNTGIHTARVENGNTYITVSGLPAGDYIFTLKDSHDCTLDAAQVTVNQPEKLKASIVNLKHPTCELNNGELTVSASGGIAPYTYTLCYPNSTTVLQSQISDNAVIFNNIAYGQYDIKITDSNNCSPANVTSVTFIQYTNPSIVGADITPVACFGESNGKIEASARKGTAGIDYFELTRLSDNSVIKSVSNTFENLIAGDYMIYVFDTNGCQSEKPYKVTVEEPEALIITIDAVMPVINKGAKDGKIVFKVQGGNNGDQKIVRLKRPDNLAVDSISVTNSVKKYFTVGAGEYFLEVIDSKACTFSSDMLLVEEPSDSLQLIIKEVNNALCKSQTGKIIVEGVGGWGDYRFKRATDTDYYPFNSFDNLYPGSYEITVKDIRGATASRTVIIYEPQDSLQAKIVSSQNPACGNNGRLSIALSGGTAPYKLFSGNDTLFAAHSQIVEWRNIASGALSLHLVDANGCRFELETELLESNLPTIEEPVLQHPQAGASNGAIRAAVRGGIKPYICQWKNLLSANTGNERNEIDNDLFITELKDIPEGCYNLTVSDAGGCSDSMLIYLATPQTRYFELVKKGDETSFKASNGYAILYIDAALTEYTVISPQHTVATYSSGDVTEHFEVRNDTVYLQNISSGQWYVSGKTASGENTVIIFEIAPYQEFIFTNTEITQVSRRGDSDGEIRVEVRGGGGNNRFAWTDEKGTSFPYINGENNSILQNIPAGKYTVAVEDRYGNRIEKTLEVIEPESPLQLSVIEYKNQSCRDYANAYVCLSASGGWGDYQFRHESETYYSNGSIYRNLATGLQYFYLTDKLGVTDSVQVTITEPEYLRASVSHIDSVKCKGAYDGKITFNITGGTAPYSFKKIEAPLWTQGNEAVGLSSGYHTFIFTDKNNCEGKDTLTVYVPEPDSLLFKDVKVTHTACNEDNGKISFEMQGGTRPYSYKWTDGNGAVIGADSMINGLKQNGFYRLEVTDANGCRQYLEQLIAPSTLPRIIRVETTNVLCYGESNGTARVMEVEAATPYAPYTLNWSNGDTGEFADNLSQGQHSVTVSDGNGCSTTYYFNISQPDSLYLLVTDYKNPHCFGYSDGYIHTQTHGGEGNKTYLWSNGATTPNIDGLVKGDYSVRVTDANGCSFESQFTLVEPDYQSVDLGEDVLMCPGNTHTIDGGNYAHYRWFTDSNTQLSTGRYLNVTETGRYHLEAKTSDGCSAWGDITVTVGNNALQADLLLASDAAVGDTLYIFELSNIPVDSLKWEYDSLAFTPIKAEDEYDQPYILLLKCNKTGIYNIGLQTFSGGCYSPAVKQVEVFVRSDEDTEDEWGISPMIKNLKVYPNPNNGNFTVEIELRETADVQLTLFEIASGHILHQRTETKSDAYVVPYSLNTLNSGAYVMIVAVGNERKQVKIIIN